MEDTTEAPHTGATPSDHARAPEEDAGARRHLLVFHESAPWIYPLPASGEVIIGRSETASVRIDDALVSRHHARLALEGDQITISDLGSQKGTYVNDIKLEGARALQPNDVITVHKTTLVLHSTAPSTSATALDLVALRQRIEDAASRAAHYEHKFSILCVVGALPGDHHAIERAVILQLRRVDSVAWNREGALYVMLPDAGVNEAVAIAARIRGKLERAALRIGHVTCPTNGFDVEDLMTRAFTAAVGAPPGEIAGLERAFQTLTIGTQRVIVADPTVVRLYALIERLAPVGIPVLITGETGCGKELVATAIHTLSHRAGKQLISLNCAALHEHLVESELFGHERGAFSGAVSTKPGLIEAASGSTLFLDEIGELAPAIQAKLLRVIETHRVTRVGDVHERAVDVRIVAATNRDLEADVVAGRFRRDLFFRLSAATLYLPPLRQRTTELPYLAAAFLDEACREGNRTAMRISDGAMALLLAHPWPGNIRELKNLMQYLAAALPVDVLLAEHISERLGGSRAVVHVPATSSEAPRFRPLAEELRDLEIRRMTEALEATGGNQTKAAGLLAMPVRTFFEKAKHYSLTPNKKKKQYDH
jgi:two-component system, NtrC family, response regulator AtoC